MILYPFTVLPFYRSIPLLFCRCTVGKKRTVKVQKTLFSTFTILPFLPLFQTFAISTILPSKMNMVTFCCFTPVLSLRTPTYLLQTPDIFY